MSSVAGGCLPWVGSDGVSPALAEYERQFVAQRNQIEALQNQVSGLLHERNFMKASTANDIRSFCLNHLASAGSAGSGTSRGVNNAIATSTTSSSTSSVSSPRSRLGGHGHLENSNSGGSTTDVETIPVYDLLMFLYRYSNGLIPPPENKRKRTRSSSAGVSGNGGCSTPSGSNSRLIQRMLTRQRLGGGCRE